MPRFQNIEDRKKLVTGYLERHLKELDQTHLATLVTVPGAENPLYLRVVLGELRVFGAFGQLREKLARDFGTTPIEAFTGVLRRLETDPPRGSTSHQCATHLWPACPRARRSARGRHRGFGER